MPPIAAFDAPSRGDLAVELEQVFGEHRKTQHSLRSEAVNHRPRLDLCMALLSPRSDFDEASRALGALITDGAIGPAP
ncbi:MAG: hypothetical protein GDA36_09900 [Rhodobacteraceae bacterium]|nr:hypothetical protein [Paracoccaceae bacterium]